MASDHFEATIKNRRISETSGMLGGFERRWVLAVSVAEERPPASSSWCSDYAQAGRSPRPRPRRVGIVGC